MTENPKKLTCLPYFSYNPSPNPRVDWITRDVCLKNTNGEVIFERKGIDVPAAWSQQAVDIVVSRYLHDSETSIAHMVERVVSAIVGQAEEDEYFETEKDLKIFGEELTHLILHQNASFNSPVWFNVGADPRPQCAACFILSVEDSMDSIMDLTKTEAMIFKRGSGVGVNLSAIRGKSEWLSNGGRPSGPVSFMKGFDAFAGVVKSGGKTRRAASMRILDIDHPDIIEFINCKAKEEKKAWALISSGLSIDQAYESVWYQNTNNTVRIPDAFMKAVADDTDWHTIHRKNKVVARHPARDILRQIAEAIHVCGDPGIQFSDTINAAHMCPSAGPINGSNPCQPKEALVLTMDGIRMLGDIRLGSIIWSGKRWTKVVHKECTGVKKVFKYHTTAGRFLGTENHRIISRGKRCEIKSAQTVDVVTGPKSHIKSIRLDDQAVVDGLMTGDGSFIDVGERNEKWFSDFIHSISLPETYRHTIPKEYLEGSFVRTRSFLRGLYSANGIVLDCGAIQLKAVSFAVIEGAQAMLSSIGIQSYYTTNAPKGVQSENDTCTCKQSYDLNITSGRALFRRLVGFIQKYKTEKLDEVCKKIQNRSRKESFEIIQVECLGEMPVYDIAVDAPEHTYWTDGMLVSNCGEFLFLDNSACNLASLNLMKFLDGDGNFLYDSFKRAVEILITAQDLIVSLSSYPTPEIEKNSLKYRPLGLGYANLGAVLMAKGLPYDSDEARDFAAEITEAMTRYAYIQSARLGQVKGAYDVAGFRNAQVTVLAPTGTIGFMMDCDTTGVEPDFALVKTKKLAGGGEMKLVNNSVHRALESLGYEDYKVDNIVCHLIDWAESIEESGIWGGSIEGSGIHPEHLPVFDCAVPPPGGKRSIDPMAHVKMVAAVQPHISGGISKTVNVPNETTVEYIEELIVEAWKLKVKSLTIYRDGCKQSQPLNVKRETPSVTGNSEAPGASGEGAPGAPVRRRLLDTRDSLTHRFSIAGHEGYVTVGLYEDGKPGEIFISMSKQGSTISGLMDSFAISISLALQYGVPLETLCKKFSHTRYDPSGFTGNPDIPLAKSITDYLFRWLAVRFIEPETVVLDSIEITGDVPTCADCGTLMLRSGTCHKCPNCGSTSGCS